MAKQQAEVIPLIQPLGMSDDLRLQWRLLTANPTSGVNGFDFRKVTQLDRVQLLAELDSLMCPPDDRECALILENVFEILNFELNTIQAEGYLEVLSEIPRDLLGKARKVILKKHKWSPPPTPADFYMAVELEIKRRQTAHARLQWAIQNEDYIQSLGE